MNTNDTLLTEMIKQDMQRKGISCYYLTDEVADNPKRIEVGANEVVYVCYFATKQREPFNVELVSGTTKVSYNEKNTKVYYRAKLKFASSSANNYDYIESALISRHWSNVKITFTGEPTGFFLRYVKAKFSYEDEKS